ncbi:MAG: hypothetical protein IPJ74_00915 [Saprospiraceae bacterium]|nr:hypothetical protein [Saprospiraceae bacterium]
MKILTVVALVSFAAIAFAQQPEIQYFRPYDQKGVNTFEPKKNVEIPAFEGIKVRIGGAFTQQYQSISHENKADVKLHTDGKTDLNKLYPLGNGFNLAQANLNFNVQLEDGISLTLENYMSSRHHQEFWVKGGFVQVDKLPMFGNPEWFTKYVRVKIGHFGVNYGDQQFRRTDGGNAMYNPFVGNYIMDQFATEIGGEVYIFPTNDLMVMAGVTNGLINGNVADVTKKPSFYAKLAFDKQVNEDFRVRLSGSAYMNEESGRNTLFGGDRTGSRFYFAMEPEYYLSSGVLTKTGTADKAFSGRINPGFSTNVATWQVAPFLKFKGLEVFATYEQAKGYASSDPKAEGASKPEKRKVDQIAVEGVYRFLKNEQVYIGGRYNTVSGRIDARTANDLTVNRYELVAGWYATKNLLLKGAYVNQEYKDYPSSSIYAEGLFNGLMVEAVLAF